MPRAKRNGRRRIKITMRLTVPVKDKLCGFCTYFVTWNDSCFIDEDPLARLCSKYKSAYRGEGRRKNAL